MAKQFSTTQERDYGWKILLSEAKKRANDGDNRFFGFVPEPRKFLPFEESTYNDHFGPKVNFPVEDLELSQAPMAAPFASDRAKHLVSITQRDFDGRKFGTNTGYMSLSSDLNSNLLTAEEESSKNVNYGDPLDILNSVGPVPLVKACRTVQNWKTTYQRDYGFET